MRRPPVRPAGHSRSFVGVVAALFALVGLALLVAAWQMRRSEQGLLASGAFADARVVEMRTEQRRREATAEDRQGSVGWRKEVDYTVQVPVVEFVLPGGRRVRFEGRAVAPGSLQAGEAVAVRYPASDPTQARLEAELSSGVEFALAVIGGAAVLPAAVLAGAALWRRTRSRSRSRHRGV